MGQAKTSSWTTTLVHGLARPASKSPTFAPPQVCCTPKPETFFHRTTTALILGRWENPEFQSYRQAMERHRVPSETLTPEALAQRFPGIHLRGEEVALSDHTAGVLFADKALKAVQVKRGG